MESQIVKVIEQSQSGYLCVLKNSSLEWIHLPDDNSKVQEFKDEYVNIQSFPLHEALWMRKPFQAEVFDDQPDSDSEQNQKKKRKSKKKKNKV